jgi:hypothetical protein
MSATPCRLQKGQLFDSFDDFKSALDDWAVQAKFSHRAKKSNPLTSQWTRYMNTRFERKQTAQALFDSDNGDDYTEFALKTLCESLENSQHRRVYLADHGHGQVHSFSGNNYVYCRSYKANESLGARKNAKNAKDREHLLNYWTGVEIRQLDIRNQAC